MKLCVVAGEASGDLHASEVIRELRVIEPSLQSFGIGGDLLAAQGMQILHHAREMGIVGLFNVLRHLPMFRRIFRELLDRIRTDRPDAVLLVDYPDFNLRLARKVHELGIPVIYYISPQVWAWRKRRVSSIARTVDHMLVIFPFEEPFYRQHSVPVTYVGHPLVEQLETLRVEPRELPASGPVRIALMPGSRSMEVESLLPPMLEAVRLLWNERTVVAFVVRASTISSERLAEIIGDAPDISIVQRDGRAALATADLSISSSGTATLECAILGVPVVVVYKLSSLTYFAARWLVRLPHFSLVNIVAGRRVVPELIQGQVTGARIAAEASRLLETSVRRQTVAGLTEVRQSLGGEGASRRAAGKIATLIRESLRASDAGSSG